MAGITLAQAEAQLAAALAALEKAMTAQEYSISTGGMSRSLSRPKLEALEQQVSYWNRMVQRLTRGGLRVRGVTIVRG